MPNSVRVGVQPLLSMDFVCTAEMISSSVVGPGKQAKGSLAVLPFHRRDLEEACSRLRPCPNLAYRDAKPGGRSRLSGRWICVSARTVAVVFVEGQNGSR